MAKLWVPHASGFKACGFLLGQGRAVCGEKDDDGDARGEAAELAGKGSGHWTSPQCSSTRPVSTWLAGVADGEYGVSFRLPELSGGGPSPPQKIPLDPVP